MCFSEALSAARQFQMNGNYLDYNTPGLRGSLFTYIEYMSLVNFHDQQVLHINKNVIFYLVRSSLTPSKTAPSVKSDISSLHTNQHTASLNNQGHNFPIQSKLFEFPFL